MTKFLELWCVDSNGIPLFYHKPEDEHSSKLFSGSISIQEPQLMSGFLTAVQTMADEALNDFVTVIELETSKLLFVKEKKITFIGRILINQGVNSAKYALQNMVKKFNEMYKEILLDWEGNTKVFEAFESNIKSYF
jgi:hypothetical protein